MGHYQGRILGRLWGPRPPGVTKGTPKNKKKEGKEEREKKKRKRKRKIKEGKKGEKIDISINREGHHSEADLK